MLKFLLKYRIALCILKFHLIIQQKEYCLSLHNNSIKLSSLHYQIACLVQKLL